MKFSPLFALSALIAVIPTAFAQSTTDLTVTGVITPASCTPSISNGGNFDFGRISAQDLNETAPTYFKSSDYQLRVVCDGSTRFALRGIDGRPEGLPVLANADYGLAPNGDQKIGSYSIRTPQASYVADNTTGISSLWSLDNGATWRNGDYSIGGELAGYIFARDSITGYATTGTTEPMPISSFMTNMYIAMTIFRSQDLDLSNEVPIDGAATVEVLYL